MQSVGTASEGQKKCIPFVSEYTDCIDENQCSGCSKCTCTAEGSWSCSKVNRCDERFQSAPVDDNDIDTALLMMDSELKKQRKRKALSSRFPFVPQPTTQNSILLVEKDDYKINIADEIMDLLRPKRSVNHFNENGNDTIKFYHTLDDVNEDKLNNTNMSGTLKARKLEVDLPKLSRRAGALLNNNTSNPLHIEYNKVDMFQHINDNKIDTSPHYENKFDIHEIVGNYSQKQRDKELSKVIVKEMRSGTEVIGDKRAPIMSNVSFTPENETFGAMTYIAGNLLNKLWNMETDSSETIETEVLKHEKIAELLDLFKEPLTINQESLLKNAIHQLSSAIDKNKDIKNLSLCEQLGEVKEFFQRSNFSDEMKTKDCDKDKTQVTDVIHNVNNVINLVQKLEDIQSRMSSLKSLKHTGESTQTKESEDFGLRKESKISSNLFGEILESTANLLSPIKSDKKLKNKIRNINLFRKDYDFKNRFKNIFNIALGNITMTTKDKIVLDYLTHIENNPGCLLHGKILKTKSKPLPTVEGNILLNLSEFFKMKSLSDLLQLVGPDKLNTTKGKVEKDDIFSTFESTTKSVTKASSTTTSNVPINYINKLAASKEKLKAHLKTILEDLVEMQNAQGVPKNSDLKINDVLPCIYNILNADKPIKNKNEQESVNKLASIFDNLKKELKYASYRRTNPVTERPKSVIVWERLVKNLRDKPKLTRRNINVKPPKSVNELKNIMNKLEIGSNTYKNIAIVEDVPPADRLTLLKTLHVDVKKYITILENIKNSFEAGIIPTYKITEFIEFIDNVAKNIDVNRKVVKKINQPKFDSFANIEIRKPLTFDWLSYNQPARQEFTLPKDPVAFNTKITRDQVINQLIKNRINMYIRIKETKGHDLNDDINYDIAKKIQLYLESGNYRLARELYSIFSNRQKNISRPQDPESVTINTNKYLGHSILDKEPLIKFEELKTGRASLPNQNHLMQQLINMKNMRI